MATRAEQRAKIDKARDLAASGRFPSLKALAAEVGVHPDTLSTNRVRLAPYLGPLGANGTSAPMSGLDLRREATTPKTTSLAGKSVAFTGKLSGLHRDDAAYGVRQLGGCVQSQVDDHTDVLVIGAASPHVVGPTKKSRKLREAEKRGVTILTEDEFVALDPPNIYRDQADALGMMAEVAPDDEFSGAEVHAVVDSVRHFGPITRD